MRWKDHALRKLAVAVYIIWLLLVLVTDRASAQAAASPVEDDDSDGYVLLQAEDPSMPVSTWASQVGQDLSDCVELPIPGKGWASCKLAPAAVAAPAAANRVIETLKALQNRMQPGNAAGISTSSAGTQPRLFKRVGRSKKIRLAVRHLHQETQAAAAAADPAAAAAATAAAAQPAGSSLPPECSSGSCTAIWGMNRIKAPELWTAMGSKMPLTSITRKVSIIDTGADLANRNVGGQFDTANSATFTDAAQRSEDSQGGRGGISTHGSHVFCTVAGAWGGGDPTGIAGVLGPAPGSVVSCNVFGRHGDGDGATASVADIVRCTAHVRKANAHWVVNLSLGGEWQKDGDVAAAMKDAFNTNICEAGGIIVVAAHNYKKNVDPSNSQTATYPAAFAGKDVPCLIAVASIEQGDRLSEFSNYGSKVRIAAPGTNIVSCANTLGGTKPWASTMLSGTSMASPLVAGAAALLMNAFPKATNTEVVSCLLDSATDPITYYYYSYMSINGGILNVKAAYDCVAALYTSDHGAVDCTQQSVPVCVMLASGVLDPACKSSSDAYCYDTGNGVCKYTLKNQGTVCNKNTNATCTGTSGECPQLGPSRSPCTAAENAQCEVPGLCSNADGCRCTARRRRAANAAPAAGGCACSATRGFAPITNAEGINKCRWNITFKGFRVSSVPMDSRVALPISLGDGKCPPAGTKIVEAVTINEEVACPSVQHELSASTVELGESCGQYVYSTQHQGAAVGACHRLHLVTTDRRSYNLVIQYR